jgi:nitroreductase
MIKRLPDLKNGTEDTILRRAPAMILLHANRGEENYRADITIAATCGLLAAHSLGLGGTFIDLVPPAVERSAELRSLFSIPHGDEVVSAIIIGYPKYRYQRAIRRELNQVTWL